MVNMTIAVDEEVLRKARIVALERGDEFAEEQRLGKGILFCGMGFLFWLKS